MCATELDRCPRCGNPWITCKSLRGGPSEFWKECANPNCNTYLNTYIPQQHQFEFHEDSHPITGNFGGYGSGKTLTSREELYKHMFITPNGASLIGANVISQMDNTIKRELESDIPAAFIKSVNSQKAYLDLINGHRILYRPLDDPDKLRSYNLTSYIILEASEVKPESFTQLGTRLRNLAATVPKRDKNGEIMYRVAKNGVKIPLIQANWQKGIIESNPSAGWIRDDVLLQSGKIYKHGEIMDDYEVDPDIANPMMSTHVTSTSANEFLPDDFIERNSKGKPLWWVSRYLFGSFLYKEGLVYPRSRETIIEDVEIPKHWKRILAFDYGLTDDAVFLLGAVDPDKGVLHIYDECRTNENNLETLAALFFEFTKDIPVGGWISPPIIDPKSGPKRDYDKRSLADHFLDYGISFVPGAIDKDSRIMRLNTYIETGKIVIHKRHCAGLIKELDNYAYKRDESLDSGFTGKPVDKDDHAISALEWITMALPADPKNLIYGVYGKDGVDLTKALAEDEVKTGYWALTDDDDYGNQTFMDETPYEIAYNFF